MHNFDGLADAPMMATAPDRNRAPVPVPAPFGEPARCFKEAS